MIKECKDVTLNEALDYIDNFGGIEKAQRMKYLSMFITYEDYEYHNKCLVLYEDWLLGDGV